jgi:hypothetical protein
MDHPVLSGVHRGRRSSSYHGVIKNGDTETSAELGIGARATNGKAAVGAQTLHGMTIVDMANPAHNQTFLRGLQTHADSTIGLAEGIVAQTADGLVELRTIEAWKAHKLASNDDTGTDRFKHWSQLEEQTRVLQAAAEAEIVTLKLTSASKRLDRELKAAIEQRAAGDARRIADNVRDAQIAQAPLARPGAGSACRPW